MPTIAYSTSTETAASRNRVAIARVAAAGRITAERKAAEKRRADLVREAAAWRTKLDKAAADLGAVTGSAKICLRDGGKLRTGQLPIAELHDRVELYTRLDEHDIEISYLDANGDFLDEDPAAA